MKKALLIFLFLAFASVCVAQTSVQGRRFDVRSFGAKCDASTDDTTAIAAAITAATATGGVVELPDGTCVVTGLTVPGGVTLKGKGRDVTIIKSTTNAIIVNCVEGAGAFAFTGPQIYDLTIRGTLAAGSSQIGLKVDDIVGPDLYLARAEIRGVTVNQAGSHGVYVGNAFSSRFIDVYSDNNTGYPFLINSLNMPSNHYESLYAQQVTATGNAGFRVLAGNFICISCNGINVSPAGSYNAIIGSKTGVDGSVSNIRAYAQWINCNFESAMAGGILHYYNSASDFSGHNQFAGDGSASGAYKALVYEVDTSIFPPYFSKGRIDDSTVFANSPASFYASSSPIWSNDLPPLTINGQGPKIAGDAFQTTYRNTTTSRNENLYRSDGYFPVTVVTTSTSFTNPGNNYYEVTCASNCTLTLPWPGWYAPASQPIVVKNLSTSGVIVTLSANSGGTVNTPNGYTLIEKYQSVTLMPDSTSLDYRVASKSSVGMATRVPFYSDTANTTTDSDLIFDGFNLQSGRFQFTGGTAGAPGLAPSGDTDTGFYSSAANTLGFAANGANVLSMGTAGLTLGVPGSVAGTLILGNTSNSNTTSIISGAPASSISLTLPATLPASAGCLQVSSAGVITQTGSACGSGGGVGGSGTTNTLAKFSAASTIADSIITESSGPATIAIAGRESITGLTITTDATNTVASLTAAATFTKNDTNTRVFDVVSIKPTLNFGGSNTGTTVNYLAVDSTNTAVTGSTVNLATFSYGGSLKFGVDSSGAVTFATGVRQVFVPSTTVASLNFGQVASDPSSPVNGDCVYNTGSSRFRCYENGAWGNMIGATPTLTSTQVPFGDGSNLLTSSSAFTYNTSTKLLSIVNGSGAASLTLNGSSDTSKVTFGAGSVPGNQGGIVFPFVGGGNSSGPGVWWASSASYGSMSGLYINNGLTWQGANSTHDHFKVAAATGTSSNGTVIWDFAPSSSLLTQTLSTSVTGNSHVGDAITLTSTGTTAANFGYQQTFTLENASGSNVAATAISNTWATATAAAETGRIAFSTNLAGAGVGEAFVVEGSQFYGTYATANITGAATINFNSGNSQTLTLTGNVTATTLTGLKSGGLYFIIFKMDGVGGRTLASSNIKVSGADLTITGTATTGRTLFQCMSDGSSLFCSKELDIR